MREHGNDRELDSGYRPRGDRIERDGDDAMYRAVAAGRVDLLGAGGVLGLQRVIGNAGVGGLLEEQQTEGHQTEEQDTGRSPVHDVVNSGGGSPLDADTRADMEARFGHDFGDVRVHTGGAAHESARSVHAQAYTVGSNVVFSDGHYDPGSDQGRHMLAHELTHVVQQRSGPVDGTDAGGGVKVSDPSDRFEREAAANADRLMATPPATTQAQAAAPAAPAAVQRAEDETEEPETAQTYVQRAEDETEGEESES